LPGVTGGPEHLFRVDDMRVDGDRVRGSMVSGSWMTGPDGLPSPGALGVFADDLLGSAIIRHRPPGRWSVSTEISIDVLEPVPGDGSTLRGGANLVHANAAGALATGQVLDASGQVIAVCQQRGRFVDDAPAGIDLDAPVELERSLLPDPEAVPNASALLGVRWAGCGSRELALPVTDVLVNPLGNLHGGVALCASELVAGQALLGSGPPLVTASVHITFVRPSPLGMVVTLTGRVLHRGRTLGVVEVVGTSPEGKVCTLATVAAHQAKAARA
jgi:uncharacterized protein (TIGR00369 family)